MLIIPFNICLTCRRIEEGIGESSSVELVVNEYLPNVLQWLEAFVRREPVRRPSPAQSTSTQHNQQGRPPLLTASYRTGMRPAGPPPSVGVATSPPASAGVATISQSSFHSRTRARHRGMLLIDAVFTCL